MEILDKYYYNYSVSEQVVTPFTGTDNQCSNFVNLYYTVIVLAIAVGRLLTKHKFSIKIRIIILILNLFYKPFLYSCNETH